MSKKKKSEHPFKGMGVNLGTKSISGFPTAAAQPSREKIVMPTKLDLPDAAQLGQRLHEALSPVVKRELIPVPAICCSITLGGDRHVGITTAHNELVFIQRHGKADAHLDQYVNTRYRTKGEARRLIEYIERLMIHLPE